MEPATKSKLQEMQTIISKMPLQSCWVLVVPEFGLRWRDVAQAVRNNRLPMTAASVARVLCRHAGRSLSADEVDDLIARLRLKLIATQARKWHVIRLIEPTEPQMTVAHLMRALPSRVARVLAQGRQGRAMQPEVQTVNLGELIYLSVQMVSTARVGPIVYVASPPCQPIALVSSLTSSLLKAVVNGLGYKSFEDAQLFGADIPSLLRIADEANTRAEHLAAPPEYAPVPVVTTSGVDFTHAEYDQWYVDQVLGPDPQLLTELQMTTTRPFYDPSRLNKQITLNIKIKSDDVAKTLRSWVKCGALAPTSELLQVFNKIKRNKFDFQLEDVDADVDAV